MFNKIRLKIKRKILCLKGRHQWIKHPNNNAILICKFCKKIDKETRQYAKGGKQWKRVLATLNAKFSTGFKQSEQEKRVLATLKSKL